MTRYLAITPQHEPADLGLDASGRAQYFVNILALKRPSATFIDDLIAILEAAGVGTGGVTIFGTSKAAIPLGDGPFLAVRATPGTPPIGTHNDGPAAYVRPGAQLVVHARSAAAAEAMAQAAYDALIAVRNQEVA